MKRIITPLCMLLLASCYYDKEDQLYPQPSTGGTACDTANISYATHVAPIMSASCAIAGGCHDAAAKSFGYDLSSYDGVKAASGSTRFLGAIKHESGISPMPKGGTMLGDCEITRISAWINAGMPQ